MPDGQAIGALYIIDRQARQLSATETQRLRELAEVVTQLLALRLALHQHSEQAGATWVSLYNHLDTSLKRLDTLAEFARWEEVPTTPAALHYQQARQEEIELVTRTLGQQIAAAQATLTTEGNSITIA